MENGGLVSVWSVQSRCSAQERERERERAHVLGLVEGPHRDDSFRRTAQDTKSTSVQKDRSWKWGDAASKYSRCIAPTAQWLSWCCAVSRHDVTCPCMEPAHGGDRDDHDGTMLCGSLLLVPAPAPVAAPAPAVQQVPPWPATLLGAGATWRGGTHAQRGVQGQCCRRLSSFLSPALVGSTPLSPVGRLHRPERCPSISLPTPRQVRHRPFIEYARVPTVLMSIVCCYK